MQPIFITGTGTQVGKTLISAIVTETLHADYWKPVQTGSGEGTDAFTVRSLISNKHSVIHKEIFSLMLPASPHIAARDEEQTILVEDLVANFPSTTNRVVVEGAGGILVPLNEREFMVDLARALDAIVIIVSKNELGSINHSLLTAEAVAARGIAKAGWIFNDAFMDYEDEIASWSGFDKIAHVPFLENVGPVTIAEVADQIRKPLLDFLC